jgi:hypothetical protein
MSGLLLVATITGCGGGSAKLTELQRVRSGTIEVVVLSPRDALRHGRTTRPEFKSADGTSWTSATSGQREHVDVRDADARSINVQRTMCLAAMRGGRLPDGRNLASERRV